MIPDDLDLPTPLAQLLAIHEVRPVTEDDFRALRRLDPGDVEALAGFTTMSEWLFPETDAAAADEAEPLGGFGTPIVPADFPVSDPPMLATPGGDLVFVPLGPVHNASDFVAWTGARERIRSTRDFAGGSWPPADDSFGLAANLDDLRRHAQDFAARTGFTWTVLLSGRACAGCVYVYPSRLPDYDVSLRTWVIDELAAYDLVVRQHVYDWLRAEWPFGSVHANL